MNLDLVHRHPFCRSAETAAGKQLEPGDVIEEGDLRATATKWEKVDRKMVGKTVVKDYWTVIIRPSR